MSAVARQERLMQVIIGPHVSEKSTVLADSANQVVFKVRRDATKAEIRKAVEMLFEVSVVGVSTVLIKGKAKRFGALQGKRSDWKKAYVRIAEGQDIDFLDAE
ncbi:MAG: 50S ribosomal protein L23 [Gammaproteobacteria bacterium]|jgi:large subunit ribosomal protein L23|nr:50S ribosomal protein L23 [Gammaproteobacteria bacterium]